MGDAPQQTGCVCDHGTFWGTVSDAGLFLPRQCFVDVHVHREMVVKESPGFLECGMNAGVPKVFPRSACAGIGWLQERM